MKQLLSLFLAFFLLVSSLGESVAQTVNKKTSPAKKTCENGECIQPIVNQLQSLGDLYRHTCLPKNIKEAEIGPYHQKHGFTEECWKIITEIKHLEDELLKQQGKLESRLGCSGGGCKSTSATAEDLNTQILNLSKVEKEVSCTAEKKTIIKNQCPSDMNCALMSSAIGMGGYMAELMIPSNWKPSGCHLGDDSCVTQLVTGFIKAAFTFFESVWDLVKILGKKTKDAL